MNLNDEMRQRLREEIEQFDPSLTQLLDAYPDINHWQLRTFYADVKRDLVREAIQQNAFAPPVVEAPTLSKKALEAIHAGWMRPIRIQMDTLPPVRITRATRGKVHLVISDIHAPDQDDHAMDVMFQIGRTMPLDGIIINGDLFDCASLSRFTPNAEQHLRWVDERQEALKVIARIRQNFPGTPIWFIPGNHDVRPINWINSNALPLQNLMSLEQWLGIDDPALGIEVVHDGKIFLAEGNLMIKHGVRVSQNAGMSVKKEMDTHGLSVIMGHVHRRAMVEVTKTAHDLVGIELGCLCSLNPAYIPAEETANWQHGFAVVTELGGPEFEVELVRIHEGAAFFRGRTYESRFQLAA